MESSKIDTNGFYEGSRNKTLIIAGVAGLITDEGYTFHEAMQAVEDLKRDTFPALMVLFSEEKAKRGK